MAQITATIDEFQARAKRNSMFMTLLQSTATMASGIENGIQHQIFQVNGSWTSRYHSLAPSTLNECACSVAFDCPDPMWSGGQFICRYGHNCTLGTIVWSIPGIVKSCIFFEKILSSDLRCFFNRTCLNIILSMHDFDMLRRNPLPAASLNITALNSSVPSRFLPNDTLLVIFSNLMVEEWQFSIDYEHYYASCAPNSCTYTISRRLDVIYIVTTIVGLFGGVSLTLRLLIPIVAKLIYWVFITRPGRHVMENRGKIWYRLFLTIIRP